MGKFAAIQSVTLHFSKMKMPYFSTKNASEHAQDGGVHVTFRFLSIVCQTARFMSPDLE
jgi:hypothetical protein